MSRLSINLWGQKGCNGAICSTRIQASSDDHQEAHLPTKISERFQWVFGLDFPWMFRPPSRSSDVFFCWVQQNPGSLCCKWQNPFEKNTHFFTLEGVEVYSVFQDSRLKSRLDSGEKMCRSDAWKGGVIYKSGALQRCFMGVMLLNDRDGKLVYIYISYLRDVSNVYWKFPGVK